MTVYAGYGVLITKEEYIEKFGGKTRAKIVSDIFKMGWKKVEEKLKKKLRKNTKKQRKTKILNFEKISSKNFLTPGNICKEQRNQQFISSNLRVTMSNILSEI